VTGLAAGLGNVGEDLVELAAEVVVGDGGP
jgi:hypothetical protein